MEKDDKSKGERIAKIMARAGLCSRRDAERWIEQGRVAVNGRTLDTPACIVGPDDQVRVDGKALPDKEQTRLFLYHKPAGLITSAKDERGRKTVFDALPDGLPRLISVGRLDYNTEGLLLLTNNGELSRALELPATGWVRHYRVRAHGACADGALESLKKGVTIDGVKYGSIEAHLESVNGANNWIKMSLSEGKNREVRRVLEHLGLSVNRLIRISYGPFHLGNMPKGTVKEVSAKVIREQCGAYLKS